MYTDYCKTHHNIDQPRSIPQFAVEMLVHSVEDDGTVWCWWLLAIPDGAVIDVDAAQRALAKNGNQP